MTTLLDFAKEVLKIMDALDHLEVKGRENAKQLVYAHDKCTEIIREINRIAESHGQRQENQNGDEGGCEDSGEPDSDVSDQD